MKRIDLAILKSKKDNGKYKYQSFEIDTYEEIKELIIIQDCPCFYDIKDCYNEGECEGGIDKCKKCWNTEV